MPRETPSVTPDQLALPAAETSFASAVPESTDIVPAVSSALDAQVEPGISSAEVLGGEIEERFFGPGDVARMKEALSKPPRIPEVVVTNEDGTVSVEPDNKLIAGYVRLLGVDGISPMEPDDISGAEHEAYHQPYHHPDAPRVPVETREGYPYVGYTSHTIYSSAPKPPIYAERTDAPADQEAQAPDDMVAGEVIGLSLDAIAERSTAHFRDLMEHYRSGELKLPTILPRVVEVQEDGTVREVPRKIKTDNLAADPDMLPLFENDEYNNNEG